jgi:hypothetical protein
MSTAIAKIPSWLSDAIQNPQRHAKASPIKGERTCTNKRIIALSRGDVPFLSLSFEKGHRDNSLYTVARALYRGGMDPQEAQYVLDILAKNCNPPFPEKEVLKKIESAFKDDRNLALEVRELISGTSGGLKVTEVDKILDIGTKRDKENRKKIFQRLVAEGLLEKMSPGHYRIIEADCDKIDYLSAPDGPPLPVKWPLELERLVKMYSKNLMVCAGSKDAGKTAFMLNLARLNQEKFKIHYFSSEIGAQEFRERLKLFEYPLESWKLNVWERSSNFADAIDPDAFNIIDFMEISDNFYNIGKELLNIHTKLKTGIAAIAIQKDPKKELGRGDTFSLEKPRLYVTMDNRGSHNEFKIISGKNWASERNPKGIIYRFKLVNGAKIINMGEV